MTHVKGKEKQKRARFLVCAKEGKFPFLFFACLTQILDDEGRWKLFIMCGCRRLINFAQNL
jgi:hypothetical protein